MATDLKTIIVEPDSELAAVVDQAADGPVLLEKDGQRFRLARAPEDLFANYDPERTRAAIEQVRGILAGVDAEALKAEIRAQRGHDCPDQPD